MQVGVREPIKITDCNYCPHLNITEEKQRIEGNKTGHYCNKYNKPVYHMGNRFINGYEPSCIYPCDECEMTIQLSDCMIGLWSLLKE